MITANDKGRFEIPEKYYSDVTYGDTIKGLAVNLYSEGVMANDRIAGFINSLTNDVLHLSNGSVYNFCRKFPKSSEPYISMIEEELFLFILSIPALESAHSIRFLYRHFLSGITKKSLNAFYYVCSYAKIDYSGFMNVTARAALRLIPDSLKSQPVFICIDDTMVTKFGRKFENISTLFDHAAHNGSNYLNGHCFVSLMLCIPVWNHDKISYLAVPLGYRIWHKTESKLELAASMVRQVMPEFSQKKNVIILCDSWYTKQNPVSIVNEYENLDLIGNARSDSVIYDLAPAPTE